MQPTRTYTPRGLFLPARLHFLKYPQLPKLAPPAREASIFEPFREKLHNQTRTISD
jgi:hypothetical protein